MNESRILLLAPTHSRAVDIGTYLSDAGCAVVVVNTVVDAKEKLCGAGIDLMIAPFETVSELLMSAALTAGVPVMCIVEKNIAEWDVSRLYALGCVDYITLPVCKPALLVRVKNQLRVVSVKKRANDANDYLYSFCMPVFQDFKNNYKNTVQMIDNIREDLNGGISRKVDEILEGLKYHEQQCFEIVKEHYLHAQNESQHRGGFVRSAME